MNLVLPVYFQIQDPQYLIVAKPARSRKGGKPAADMLTAPVKANSKRGRFLEWFLAGNTSIDSVMEHFGMTRGNVLTYWALLNRDHGLGYTLTADTITPILPAECGVIFK